MIRVLRAFRGPARRALLLLAIAAAQFALFEIALRAWGHSEARPRFRRCSCRIPSIGFRLRPNARTRFVTAEFDTEIAINAQGVRDDAEIGPKPANERRIVVARRFARAVGAGRAAADVLQAARSTPQPRAAARSAIA